MNHSKHYEAGTLVRFVYIDELVSPDYYDSVSLSESIQRFCYGYHEADKLKGIRSGFHLSSAKKFEVMNSVDWSLENRNKWIDIPFGAKGMVLDFWEGENNLWQKVLVGNKTVWVEVQNLLKLSENPEDDDGL